MAPAEYAPSAVAAASQPTEQLPYSGLVRAGEPYASLLRRDFHHGAAGGLGVHSDEAERHRNNPAPGLDYTNENLFYNTAAAEAYWKDKGLPRPTSDIRQLRRDLVDWGYCLVSNALSESQLKAVRSRVYEQADGEIKAGVAYWGASPPPPGKAVPPVQLVHSLLNKGDVFRGVVEYDPQFVQGGPVIEQLIKEVLGDNFLISTFLSLITSAGNLPQNMHQDQVLAPYQTPQGPVSCNIMFLLDDFGPTNGGTLVIPGSHKLISSDGIPLKNPLPPPINVLAPAGTALIFEGRLAHGTGVNKSANRRAALIMDSRMHFMRQQEVFLLSLAPDVIQKLSPKSLARLGFRPTGMGGAEGTFRDTWQTTFRLAIADGTYTPIRQLSPESPASELAKDYTFRYSENGAFLSAHQANAADEVKQRYGKKTTARNVPGKLEGVQAVPGVGMQKL